MIGAAGAPTRKRCQAAFGCSFVMRTTSSWRMPFAGIVVAELHVDLRVAIEREVGQVRIGIASSENRSRGWTSWVSPSTSVVRDQPVRALAAPRSA